MDDTSEFSALVADIRRGPDTFGVRRRQQLRELRTRIRSYGRAWPNGAVAVLTALLAYFYARRDNSRRTLVATLRRRAAARGSPAWLKLQCLVILAAITHRDPAVPPSKNFAFRRRALTLAATLPDGARNQAVILNNWLYALIDLGRVADALPRERHVESVLRHVPPRDRRQAWFREARARFFSHQAKLRLLHVGGSTARLRQARATADSLFRRALQLEGADTNRRLNILTDWARTALRYGNDPDKAHELIERGLRVLDAAATDLNRAFFHLVKGQLHQAEARRLTGTHFALATEELRAARKELLQSAALYGRSGHQEETDALKILKEVEVALAEYEVISPSLGESLPRFKRDHPDARKAVFVMMRFAGTRGHERIFLAIKRALAKRGMKAVRADQRDYHDELLANVLTYIHGCGSGIAVFERIESEEFNPNISMEVGYMLGLRKPVCLLKERTLKHLHSDLLGRLYKTFDVQNPLQSIDRALSSWLRDGGVGALRTRQARGSRAVLA